MSKVFSEKEIEYVRAIANGRFSKDIADLVNKKFNKDYSQSQIRNLMLRYDIKNNMGHKYRKPDKEKFPS